MFGVQLLDDSRRVTPVALNHLFKSLYSFVANTSEQVLWYEELTTCGFVTICGENV